MASIITATAHGMIAGQPFKFANVVPDNTGIIESTTYYVLAAGLTVDVFTFSDALAGTPVVLTANITDGSIVDPDTYTVIDDGIMTPPGVVATPTVPTVTSVLTSGIVRLVVHLNDTAAAKVRVWEVNITHTFSGAVADWSHPVVFNLPEGTTELSIPALGSTVYAVRVRAVDVYGQAGSFCADVTATTSAGNDSLSASLADLANDVSDGIITTTKIADNAISTPKLQAGAVTADILAATIVLASLIKTANSGRRIELDGTGITLYDTDESILVRIPTNGDPVYVKGQVNADSLISQTSAEFRGVASLAGSSIMTLTNGVAAPTSAPAVVASLDSLALTSTPSNIKPGIGYDSGATSFWTASDPTVSPYYVAQEWNASTGALIRSIPSTGSLSTVFATLGATSHVADTAQAFDGATNSHITTPLTIPAGLLNPVIDSVSVYMAGHNGTAVCRLGVWSTGNNNLAESASFTASSGGATGTGNSAHYSKSLTSPLAVTAGTTYRCGWRHTSTSDGTQWDRDDGAGKTTYSGDGTSADGTGWGTLSSSSKPNVAVNYHYSVDTRLETAANIAVCTDGTHVYTLDVNGVVWKYLRATMAYVANSAVQTAITGTKANAGMFYDATAAELIITTTTGTGAGVFPKFVRVTPSTLAVSSTVYSAAAGTSFSGTTDTFRGGARLADALNASAATYWVATTSAVYAYTFSGTTATQTANRDFGTAATVGSGLTHDGTVFRGFATATPTKVWKFTVWDWTSASAIYWVAYAWYDSVGTTHETVVSPRTSLTLRRKERIQVQTAAIPTGGVDDPDKARVYMKPNATDPGAGAFKLQVTDALTARYLTDYASGGAADGGGTAFPAGTPAELKSAATGFSIKGDGTITTSGRVTTTGFIKDGGTSFPASPGTNDRFKRTDLGLWFYYDGTRWLSENLYKLPVGQSHGTAAIAATAASLHGQSVPDLASGSDIYLVDLITTFFVVGGTALAVGQSWTGLFTKRPTGNTDTTLKTVTINSGASSAWRTDKQAINALLNGGTTHFVFAWTWTKAGTPGNLFYPAELTYRIVAT